MASGSTPPIPTLATIAAASGFSVSTVSRALQGNPALPAATVRKIRAAARAVGYRPNPLVSDMMRHMRKIGHPAARGTLAYLTFGPNRDDWERHLTFVGFHQGARARAEELGFHLEPFWADAPGMKGARLTEILRARGIAGVVIGPALGLPRAPQLDWRQIAAVKLGVPFTELPLPCAVSNHFRGMTDVIARLRTLGYRRFGLVLQDHQNMKTSGMWLAPFALHMQHSRPADRVAPLLLERWREADFARWFCAHRPEVVIGLRCELMVWLERLGIGVPGQAGFVHLDRCTEPGDHAGLDQKPREVGAAAVDLLAQRLLANERGLPALAKQLLVDSVWVDGPTLRAQPANQPAPSRRSPAPRR
ncbi:MAG: LacI family DNA-binding transcriptional regulator [Lacunisphaera sp.]|jgi:DNA-binding LacI/PurR family transcriptional regulator|nr:LacI family DNA-binding transcriptional regulator [Lacunisphaera sp.]